MVTYALFRQMSRVAGTRFQKKDPHKCPQMRGGRGATGGTEKVRSLVTFFQGWLPLFFTLAYFCLDFINFSHQSSEGGGGWVVQPLHGLLPLLPSTHPSPSLGKPSASILALSTVLCNILIFICSDCYTWCFVIFLLQVLPCCLASSLESCQQRRLEAKQSQVFVFSV